MQTKEKAGFTSVDEYLDLQPAEIKATLQQLRNTIKKAAPEAEEVISYQMPAFRFHGMLAFYAAYKNHYGLYVRPKVLKKFTDELAAYEISKATIRFPFGKPLPLKLLTSIIRQGVKENLDEAVSKEAIKNKKQRSIAAKK